jgi:hypothetical protein
MRETISRHGDEGGEAHRLYARLGLDDQGILLPQNDISALEPALDIEMDEKSSIATGQIEFNRQRWPVYALTSNLNVSREIPARRRICVIVNKSGGYFGLVCDHFDTLEARDVKFQPLPACMLTPRTPIDALAIHDGRVELVCRGDRLALFLTGEDTRS